MRFLVDTNVLSEFRRGAQGNGGVRAWALGTPDADLAISVITVKEIEYGILRLARADTSQSFMFRAWLEHVILPEFDGRILPVDIPIAQRAAAYDVPDRRPAADGLIAATAAIHGLTIVTGNVKHFRPMGVPLLNPFT